MQMCKTVTLRTRELKNDMLSFYLDYYPGFRDPETMKVTRHEALGIYIYAHPKNTRERTFNDSMTEKAETIRCRRYESIVNDRYDFLDKNRMKGDFLKAISWNITAASCASTTKNGSSFTSISTTSSTANALSVTLMWTCATASGSTCSMPDS